MPSKPRINPHPKKNIPYHMNTKFDFHPCLAHLASFVLCLFCAALSLSASLLLGDGKDGQALMSWLETQERDWLNFGGCLSSVDSTITAKDVATNAEMLLAIEEDSHAADRLWSWSGVQDVAELVVG